MNLPKPFFVLLLAATCFVSHAANNVDSDICVYGGTSGGVSSAVAAARLGKSVSLLVFNNHVGGMTTSGLGVTDRGNTNSIGGVANEFYYRVGQHYNATNRVFFFEPHVAEQTFKEMLAETSVQIFTNQRIASVTMSNQRITQVTMDDGSVYRAKMFIDSSYEGDLMAKAGVTFTFGREGTNVYGEALAGIRSLGGTYNYDPYVVPGNSASGVLPFVQSGTNGVVGQGDGLEQTYNFRLCLTQNSTNKIAIAAPTNYVESQYELFNRYLAARVAANGSVQLNQVIDIQTIIPNSKTDINARDELSTDYVGASYTWATNTHAGRELIRQQHEDYIRGMFTYYATSTNVPLNVRTQMQSWGLAKDEFTDNGGWPWQIYVREARRMVSDYVMTEKNSTGSRAASDPIALGSYTIDSHGVQRLVSGGLSRWEGSIGGTVPFPYGISYRSIVPRVGECENVFSTFALSASHVAFSSCRMEPVFMMVSQSAATAAAFAIDDNVSVQSVNYAKLSAQLRADGQILDWPSSSSSTNGFIVDQSDTNTVITGAWTFGNNAGGWNGDYLLDQSTGKGTKSVKYTPTLPTNGTYEVDMWWTESSNRSTNTPVDIIHPGGTNRVLVNQKNASGGWFKLMTTNFNAGTNGYAVIRNDNTLAGTYVIADGIRFLPVTGASGTSGPVTVEIVASDAEANESGTNTARFTIVRSGNTNTAVTVNYSVSGTATGGVDYVTLTGSITIPTNVIATNIVVTPIADYLVESDETVTINLTASANYQFTTLTNATVTIHNSLVEDRPFDVWRKNNFTATELTNVSISGDFADPDGDGSVNLMEYALGLDPKIAAVPTLSPRIVNGYFTLTYTRLKSATDVSLVVEQSSNLLAWANSPGVEQVGSVDEGTILRITARITPQISSPAQVYIRLRAFKL